MNRSIITVYAASVAYSVVRYIVFAPKNIEHLPVLIVNKGVSMAAAICFAAGFLHAWRNSRGRHNSADPAAWFRAGVFGAIWHIPMSLAILEPTYFKEFFHVATEAATDAATGAAAQPRMTFAGELVFMFGGLAAALIFLLLRSAWSPRDRRLLSVAAMVALAGHTLSMGYSRGLNINASHAYMPPMWLISAAAILLALWWASTASPIRDSSKQEDSSTT